MFRRARSVFSARPGTRRLTRTVAIRPRIGYFEHLEARRVLTAFNLADLIAMGPRDPDAQQLHFVEVGIDLPTNVTANGVPDTEWSGVVYFKDPSSAEESLYVVSDEVPRIEVYSLKGEPKRTVMLNGFDAGGNDGPEGIAWLGGNFVAVVVEGVGTIDIFQVFSDTQSITRGQGTTSIVLNPNPENDNNTDTNDGLEGVAYDSVRNRYYVVKEIGTNQGVYEVDPATGATTRLNIPEFAPAFTNEGDQPPYDNNAPFFADFSDVFFARQTQSPSDRGMLFVTSEKGREDIIKIDLNPGAGGNPHVVQILTKEQGGDINQFLGQFPAVQIIQLADTVQVLQTQIEGFSMRPDGSEAYLVADDDQLDGGNDVVDFRKFRDTEGDYDGNHFMSIVDINMLHTRIVFGLGGGIPDSRYDLDNDGDVDADDGYYLVKNVMELWIGDANLDGLFNSADFVEVFQNGEYEDGIPLNSTWSEGDWNFDGEFDSGDFVAAFEDGGYSE